MPGTDEPKAAELRERQASRAAQARKDAADADSEAERLAAARRAEKAAYLAGKADEQLRADGSS